MIPLQKIAGFLLKSQKIAILIFSFLITPLQPSMAELSFSEVSALDPEKIESLAKMGESEAQYWIGKAISVGERSGTKDDIIFWWTQAGKQGNEKAAIELFDLLRFEIYSSEKNSTKYNYIFELLIPIAGSGSPRANAYLSDLFGSVQYKNQDLLFFYRERAAELGHRSSMNAMAFFYALGSTERFGRDMIKSMNLSRKVIDLPKQEYEEYLKYRTDVCNAYDALQDIYSGDSFFYKEGDYVKDKSFFDESALLQSFDDGINFGCQNSISGYAFFLINEKPSIASFNEALRLSDRLRQDVSYDDLYGIADFIAVKASAELGNFEKAKEYAFSLSKKGYLTYRDSLFSADGYDIFGICRNYKISSIGCKIFLGFN